jgi:hypothetical protein
MKMQLPVGCATGILQRGAGAIVVSLLLASAVLLWSGAIGAAAAPIATGCPASVRAADRGSRGFLSFTVCGPRDVSPSKNYDYTVVLTNGGHVGTGKVKLSVFHYDPIIRSSVRYRESSDRVDYGMYEADWTLGNLAPSRSFRVTITVSFGQHRRNSLFTELVLRAAGEHPGAGGGMKKDVFFK